MFQNAFLPGCHYAKCHYCECSKITFCLGFIMLNVTASFCFKSVLVKLIKPFILMKLKITSEVHFKKVDAKKIFQGLRVYFSSGTSVKKPFGK